MKRLICLLLALLALVGAVSAAENFTPIINLTEEGIVVHYNQSFIISDTPYTPFPLWVFVTLLGIGLLLASLILKPEQCNDIIAILAVLPLGVSAYQSLAIDMVTASGVSAAVSSCTGVWILLENHTVYHPEAITAMLVIFWIVSIANLYRIHLQHRMIIPSTSR